MKISNSKKQLARIISENGGWRWGEFGAQDGDGSVGGYGIKPEWDSLSKHWWRESLGSWFSAKKINNHHQTIVSRDEYFHLYPAQDAELVAMCADVTKENKHPEYCESVMRSIPEPSDKPTIEQLASDYKAKLEIAQQAQEVADFRRGEAEAALSRLIIAYADFGFEIKPKGKLETSGASVIDKLQDKASELAESELNITDWRDLKVGDEVECVIPNIRKEYYTGRVGVLVEMDSSHTPLLVQFDNGQRIWCYEVKFIRRP